MLIVPIYVGKQCNQEVTAKKQQAQNLVNTHCTTSIFRISHDGICPNGIAANAAFRKVGGYHPATRLFHIDNISHNSLSGNVFLAPSVFRTNHITADEIHHISSQKQESNHAVKL